MLTRTAAGNKITRVQIMQHHRYGVEITMSLSIKNQILLIAFVSIVGFSVHLVFNNMATSRNASQLNTIISQHFPMLELAGVNQVRLDKIKEAFANAAMSGEEDQIDAARDLADQFRLDNQKMLLIDASAKMKRQATLISLHFEAYLETAEELARGFVEGALEADQIQPLIKKMTAQLEVLTLVLQEHHDQSYRDFNETINGVNQRSSEALFLGILIGALIVAVLATLTLFISRRISRRIGETQSTLEAMTDGNLIERIPQSSQGSDEIMAIGNNINKMADNLSHNIRNVILQSDSLFACIKLLVSIKQRLANASSDTHTSAQNVLVLNQKLAEEIVHIRNSIEQAAIDVLSDALKDLASNIEGIVISAKGTSTNVNAITNEAKRMAENIEEVNHNLLQVEGYVDVVVQNVDTMITSLDEVRNRCQEASGHAQQASQGVESATKIFTKLGSSAEDIGGIVNLISNIVAQTNMLALNATIEAANAGEYGKGFAVVAFEVRNLARETEDAAQMISDMAEEILADTGNATQVSKSIGAMIHKNYEINQQIEHSITEQSQRVQDISRSVNAVSSANRAVTQKAMELKQSSESVISTAVNAGKKTGEIVRLTSEASAVTLDISNKTGEARKSTMQIFESSDETAKISETVSKRIDETFESTTLMRRMVLEFGDAVKVVEGIGEKLHAAQAGFDIQTPPLDIRNIKEEHLQCSLKIGDITAADNSNIHSCGLSQWLNDNYAEQLGEPELYERLSQSHQAFHNLLSGAVMVSRQPNARGDNAADSDSLRQLGKARDEFFSALDEVYQNWSICSGEKL